MNNMKLIVAVVIASILLFSPRPALAGFYSINDLLPKMRQFEKALNGRSDAEGVDYQAASEFLGYVTGVCDLRCSDFEISSDFTREQLASIVIKYVNNNPEQWSRSAAHVVVMALGSSFPKKS